MVSPTMIPARSGRLRSVIQPLRRAEQPAWATLATGALVVALAVVLIVLPPLLGAALVGGAALATVVLIRPLWGFYLLLLSIPVQDIGAKGELTLTNTLFGLTLLSWLLYRATNPRRWLPRSAVGPVFCVFVAGLALSMVVARELGPAFAALFQWVKSLFVYFLALDLIRTRRQTLGALAALIVAAAAEGAIGLVQYGTGAGPASFAIGADFSRAYGTFGKPNSYAGYLEMVLPLGIVLTIWAWQQFGWRGGAALRLAGRLRATTWLRFVPFAVLGATAIIGGAILASYSRGAWLGMASALAVMIWLAGPRSRGIAIAAALAGGILALLGGIAALPQDVRDRIGSIFSNAGSPDVRTAYITAQNFAVVEREAHWVAGINMFLSNRFLGVGLGNFNVRFTDFDVSPTFLVSEGHAHNYYIHVAAEAGLVGLCTYLLLLLVIVVTALQALRSTTGRDPLARALIIATLGTVTAVAIHNIFEDLHVLSMGIQLSTIWALPTIAAQSGWSPADPARATTRRFWS
jgi:O-antigen ligase